MELVLLGRLFGECGNLFFGLSLFLRKSHPFANDFSTRLVVFHVRGSLGYQSVTVGRVRASPTTAAPFVRRLGLLVLRGLGEVSGDRLFAQWLFPLFGVIASDVVLPEILEPIEPCARNSYVPCSGRTCRRFGRDLRAA
jgi:hypothetical protein